jgi:hypothetical protein
MKRVVTILKSPIDSIDGKISSLLKEKRCRNRIRLFDKLVKSSMNPKRPELIRIKKL